ncbi:MAG: sel1 repeat family protein [Bacilli bacterium]|nr:sel1 repeat family protein [Bacilli bacterium]
MKKNYVKMNNMDILSLGNVIITIKEIANNNNASQREIFSSIFNVNNVNNTTINNYCIGYRAIPLEYKKYYSDLMNNKEGYVDIILSIMNILDNTIYINNSESLDKINNNIKLKNVIIKLINIAKKDKSIKNSFISKIKSLDNYNAMINILNYAVLDNVQPVYSQKMNIKINKSELDEYLKIKLYYGQSYISSLISLSKKDNMYACAELGSLEFDGLVSGVKDYYKSYDYYLKAASKNHPKACWMVANLMITNKVKMDINVMWKYLNKSIELNSAAGYNTLGLCYLKGINPEGIIDIEKAKESFIISSEYGYVYAFNNLGSIYEKDGDIENAYKYYKISADMNESWALNKMGEYYRKQSKFDIAFMYYNKAIECPINERNNYAYYNLAKYYYENGNICVNIKRDSKKACEYYLKSGIKK